MLTHISLCVYLCSHQSTRVLICDVCLFSYSFTDFTSLIICLHSVIYLFICEVAVTPVATGDINPTM